MKIIKAKTSDDLIKEWQDFTKLQYGPDAKWLEKSFRFKAVESNEILGTIEGKYEPGVIYIATLMVKPDTRGKGVGKKLVEKVEDFGKQLGAHRIWLITGKEWVNRPFYEKLGFHEIAKLDDFFFHKDFVIYTKLID